MTPSKILIFLALADALTADKTRYQCPVDEEGGEYQLVNATWVSDTTVNTSGTDYRTINVKNGATTLGTITTNGSTWTAGTPVDISLSGGKSKEFTANTDVVTIESTHTGSTGAVADGRLVLEFEKIPA